jgi:hypothetical protein
MPDNSTVKIFASSFISTNAKRSTPLYGGLGLQLDGFNLFFLKLQLHILILHHCFHLALVLSSISFMLELTEASSIDGCIYSG